MQLLMAIIGVVIGSILGILSFSILPAAIQDTLIIPPLVGMILGAGLGIFIGRLIPSRRIKSLPKAEKLPLSIIEFINLVIKKMRYRKKVRADVQAELITHFQDQLKDCTTDEERDQRTEQLIADFGDAKLLGTLLRRAKKRCRPLWRTIVARTFQTVGMLILCFILYCVYILFGSPTVRINYLEEATRLTRPVADESLNAAPIYQKAIDVYKEPPKLKLDDEELSLLSTIWYKNSVPELSQQELSLLKQWLSDNTGAIALFKQAAKKPHCWWKRAAEDNVVFVALMPELSHMRRFAKMIVWQAKLKAYNGNIEEAFDDALACYRAGIHFKGSRTLLEQLIGIAIQVISTETITTILTNKQLDSQQLDNLQADIERLIADDIFIVSYETERFLGLDFIQRCYTDNGRGSGHMIPGRLKEFSRISEINVLEIEDGNLHILETVFEYGGFLAAAIASADRRQITRMFDRAFDNFQKWAHKTPWQLRQANVDLDMGLANWSWLKKTRYWPFAVLVPAVAKVNELSHRVKADVQATLTIIAVLRRNLEKGDYPLSLENLVAQGYLKTIPIDPYSDQPLVYKLIDEGFTLYSLGADFDDDGGVHSKWGQRKEGGDQVFWPIETYQQRQERRQKRIGPNRKKRTKPRSKVKPK